MIGLLISLSTVAPSLPVASGSLARTIASGAMPSEAASGSDLAADSVLRVYDLTNIDWSDRAEGDPLAIPLLPGVLLWESPKEGVSEDERGSDVSRVLEMVYSLFEEEFQ